MRLRNIPRADGVIDAHRAVIKKPEEQRGQWAQVFGNEKPIQIEIGMGKGQFILNMAKAHPEINFIELNVIPASCFVHLKNMIQRNLKILRRSVLFAWMQERLKQCLHRQRWIRSS